MRRAFVLFAMLFCALPCSLAAQRELAQSVQLPSGVTVARVCTQMSQEGVVVASLDARPLPSSGAQVLSDVSQRIARYVDITAESQARVVVYAALLLHSGAMTQQFPVRLSGDREFDSRITNALSNLTIDGDSVRGALSIPDSLRVMITFGQHEDGTPFLTSHTRCPAVAFPDNPAAVMPRRTEDESPRMTMRAMVTAAGRVDTASARANEGSDERLIDAAMMALSHMRFVPAEFDGAKIPQRVTIVVPFAAPADTAQLSATR